MIERIDKGVRLGKAVAIREQLHGYDIEATRCQGAVVILERTRTYDEGDPIYNDPGRRTEVWRPAKSEVVDRETYGGVQIRYRKARALSFGWRGARMAGWRYRMLHLRTDRFLVKIRLRKPAVPMMVFDGNGTDPAPGHVGLLGDRQIIDLQRDE